MELEEYDTILSPETNKKKKKTAKVTKIVLRLSKIKATDIKTK